MKAISTFITGGYGSLVTGHWLEGNDRGYRTGTRGRQGRSLAEFNLWPQGGFGQGG